MARPKPPLGKLSPREFLRRFWHKQPLLVRKALSPLALSPFDGRSGKSLLFELALQRDVESRVVTTRSRPAFRVHHGPFTRGFLASMPKTHWTLLVQDVDKHLPQVAEVIERFTFLPRWRMDDIMVSYATKGGSVGPHFDQYDVFLLQGLGRRRWRLGRTPPDPRLLHGTELRVLQDFASEIEIEVQPGDLLYLPPGVAHHGVAETECITLSLGFRAPSQRDLCFSFVEDLLANASDSLRYADANHRPQQHSGAIDPQALQRMRQLVREGLRPKPLQIERWFGRFVTEPKPQVIRNRAGTRLTRKALARAAKLGVTLERALGSRWAFFADQSLHLFVDGREWQLPLQLTALFAALCNHPRIRLSKAQAVVLDRDHAAFRVVSQLFRLGLLQFGALNAER